MSQGKDNPPKKKPIAEEISALASSVHPANEGEESYRQEAFYTDLLREESYMDSIKEALDKRGGNWFFNLFGRIRKRNSYTRQKISPAELLAEINARRVWHSFKEDEEKHKFRKRFFIALFVLTCSWLTTVIYFVYQNAVSPSIEDRGKLIQIQAQLDATTNLATNLFHSAMFYAANPVYKPSLFHLSDSVLIAFITSTTVAVLGLFVTAANWLYGKHNPKKKPESDNQHAGNVPE